MIVWSHILLPFVYFDFRVKKKLTEILTWLLQTRLTLIFNGGSSHLAQKISFDINHP